MGYSACMQIIESGVRNSRVASFSICESRSLTRYRDRQMNALLIIFNDAFIQYSCLSAIYTEATSTSLPP